MTLEQIMKELDLTLLTENLDLGQRRPTAGYASDMLSRVMAHAPRDGALWVTLQCHANIVAVGAVLGLSAIIITEGESPDAATIAKAKEMGVPLLATSRPTFHVVGQLWRLGLREG
ncbi:MAG TPA: DRTGG domain-containing protein [Candidatus Acidoferrum sp.]|nr:DRTGG domain-containing protein [Candidatus Acidoferrum sp.]